MIYIYLESNLDPIHQTAINWPFEPQTPTADCTFPLMNHFTYFILLPILNGLVHSATEENWMDPFLRISGGLRSHVFRCAPHYRCCVPESASQNGISCDEKSSRVGPESFSHRIATRITSQGRKGTETGLIRSVIFGLTLFLFKVKLIIINSKFSGCLFQLRPDTSIH